MARSSRGLRLSELEQARGEKSAEERRPEERVEATAHEGKPAAADPIEISASRDEPPEDLDELEDKLSAWLQCSGLHTVDKWVLSYRKHPSCWAALLMMHGVPEVSGRLRAKVENYAIYSALFLSCTIQAVMSPPDAMQCADREFDTEAASVQCQVARRVATYALLAAIVMHFYSIILAMAFVNALNETAREADVFRVFARGQGYLATFKCQQAFRRGAAFVMLAIAAVALEYIGWDAVVWIALLLTYVLRNFAKTSNLLFRRAARALLARGAGGNPDADDPYEIAPAVRVFKERVKFSRGVLGDEDPVDEDALGGGGREAVAGRRRGQDAARRRRGQDVVHRVLRQPERVVVRLEREPGDRERRRREKRRAASRRAASRRGRARYRSRAFRCRRRPRRRIGGGPDRQLPAQLRFRVAGEPHQAPRGEEETRQRTRREAARVQRTAPRDVRRRQSRGDIVVF